MIMNRPKLSEVSPVFIKEMVMSETIVYLDLTFLVHTLMNVLLLLLVSRLCRRKVFPLWLAVGSLIGSLPIVLWAWGVSWQGPGLIVVGLLLPATVFVGLRIRRLTDFIRCLFIFVVLAALSGGGVYMTTGSGTRLTPENLWIVPVLMGALYSTVYLWQRWHKTDEFLQQVLYKIELEFGWGRVELPALLDTGNDLKDPISGAPVIIVEEQAVRHVLPPLVQRFLDSSWQKESNPWTLLWQSPELAHIMSFVSTESVGGKRLLPAVRPQNIAIKTLDRHSVTKKKEHKNQPFDNLNDYLRVSNNQINTSDTYNNGPKVTVLLVKQVLSAENRFQALLHPQCVNLSGRNGGNVVQEKTFVPVDYAQESMRRDMA